MKLTLITQLTLDGVYQGLGGRDEDNRGGFAHGGWSVPYGDEEFLGFVHELVGRLDGLLLGRRTYEIFAGYWPKVSGDPISDRFNSRPKYVASTTLATPSWDGTSVIGREDLAKDVAALKEQPGRELQIHGSGEVARHLLAHDLVDTLHVVTFPVVLGSGLRLFGEGGLPTAFRTTASRLTSSGVVITSYESAGRPTYGNYGPDA
ncbi:dihydrofolate reductase family protein [Streptomyces sp. NPDC059009]|uniref:dihydrofolate reductase family protein n=1 Tax=Streptomyces sp. NPDC059009 TaxID=3346694 RepID=UPI0036BFE41A